MEVIQSHAFFFLLLSNNQIFFTFPPIFHENDSLKNAGIYFAVKRSREDNTNENQGNYP
jgi:hypothetical protein